MGTQDATPGTTTVPIDDFQIVQRGLLALLNEYANMFHRTCNWAIAGRRPIDPAGRLSEERFGPLTDLNTGDWLPGRRELVCALVKTAPNEEVIYQLREHPLAPQEDATKAA